MASAQGSSQDIIDAFWKANLGSTQPPTRPFSILPDNVYAKLERKNRGKGIAEGASVVASYAEAVKECELKVATIVAECRRNNVKYTDPHFNLNDELYCLTSLNAAKKPKTKEEAGADGEEPDDDEVKVVYQANDGPLPPCAKRVGAIFEDPQFFIGGEPNVRDTRQGAEGDCWFLSSIGSLCVDEENRHLIKRLCPPKARNEKVGVYGFVFYRDGEWISEIIDDKLYLSCPDYDDCDDSRRTVWDGASKVDAAEKRRGFRKAFQTGSDALFYGSCANQNETWVPLLEKAFAKAHGDYNAIDGGIPGQGLEDLTGGITTMIDSEDILDLDELWDEGLMHVNKLFLFGVGTRRYGVKDEDNKGRQGIEDGHAYSVLKAVKYKSERLLLIKNPWGNTEWDGPWSDGSKEWTPDAMRDLDYQFGNDGIFWMRYEDFLIRFTTIWRTRLFDADWKVTQKWTTVQVPWAGDYNPTKFRFSLSEPTHAIIVLSKLDNSYFVGLTGQYSFNIAFRLHGKGEDLHLIRGYSSGDRSASAEIDLEAGEYDVLLQISAFRDRSKPLIEDVVTQNWLPRRDKLIQVGLSYDLAQAKGQIEVSEEAKTDATTATPASPAATTEKAVVPPTPTAEASPEGSSSTAITVSSPREKTEFGVTSGEASEAPEDGPAPDPAPAPAPEPAPSVAAGDQDAAADDPLPDAGVWNATLVVGLRIFYENGEVKINTISPSNEEEAQKAKEEVQLDVDDPEKDLAESFKRKVALEEETVEDSM